MTNTEQGGFLTLNGLSLAAVAQNRKKYGSNTMPDPRVKSAWNFLVAPDETAIIKYGHILQSILQMTDK